jgi:2-haloacid dehalogenase
MCKSFGVTLLPTLLQCSRNNYTQQVKVTTKSHIASIYVKDKFNMTVLISALVSNKLLLMPQPKAVLFDAPAPRAVLFDAYGTLFDVYSVALMAEKLFPGQGQALSLLWRDKQIEYTRLVTTCNDGAHYRPFWELTRAALVYAIKKIAYSADITPANGQFDDTNANSVETLMNQYRHLSAFPENREVLQALKARSLPTGILSNGDPQMLDIAVKSAGLGDVLDHVISVDTVRKYKTHPAAYALGEQATGLKAKEILFVSSNAWDALAATWYGYQTLWVNRYGLPFEELGTQPTRVGANLRDVLSFFQN